jgi:hypothetical protein
MLESDDPVSPTQLTTDDNNAQTLRKEESEIAATRQKKEEIADGGITKAGTVLGTPLYMSPEQCNGEELDARSDIYSLGVIIYQMFTGTTPFTGDLYSLIVKHVEKAPPPIDKKRRDIPLSVSELVMSSLAKNPAHRPQSAAAFATALRANAEGEIPILEQANHFYRKHRSAFLLISISIYVPFILLSFLLLYAHLGFFLFLPPFILFANDLNKAACTFIYERWRLSPSEPIQVRSVFAALAKRFGALASTAVAGSLSVLLGLLKLIVPGVRASIDYSLYAPVVMMEEKQGKEALARSRRLSGQLRYLSLAIKLHDLFIGLLIFAVLFCSFLLIFNLNLISTLKEGGFPFLTVIFLCAGFLLPLIVGIRHSTCAIASAIIYLKARLAVGELTDRIFSQDFEESERLRGSRESYRKTASTLALFLVKYVIVLPILWLTLVASVALKDFYYSNNIVTAASDGHTDLVRELINQGVDVNSKNSSGFTALIIASQAGYIETIKALLAAGADVNARNIEGETALYYAALHGRYEVVKELISAGADVNLKAYGGRTPLMATAIGKYPINVEIARALLAAGADPDPREDHGRTALIIAIENERNDIMELLKAAGAKE